MADQDTRYRSLSAAGLGAESARQVVLATLRARPDLVVHELAPDRISVARTRRPTWALVACTCTIWLGGLGLLFLLVKHTDAGELVLRDGPRGCVVAIPPLLDDATVRALEGALSLGAPEVASGAATAGVAPRVPVDDLDGRTVARSSLQAPSPEPVPAGLVLRFDAGVVTVEPGGTAVLGRDPSPTGTAAGHVVPGDASSVSKSHLLVDRRQATATIEDLGSTNGSTLVRGDETRPLVPGAPVVVRVGDRVLLGDVGFVVEAGVAP